MQKSQTPARDMTVHRMLRFVSITAAAGVALNSLILLPVFTQAYANILYRDTWWCNLLYYATLVVDPIVFMLVYPATIYAIYRAGLKKARPVIVSFGLITLLKFILNFAVTSLTEGALPTAGDFLSDDLPMIGVMFLLEILQYAFLILMTVCGMHRFRKRQQFLAAEALLRHTEPVDAEAAEQGILPFAKLFSWRNPLQFAAFWTSVYLFVMPGLATVVHVLAQIVYNNGQTDGLGYFVMDLVSALILACIFYFVAVLMLTHFEQVRLRREADRADQI